MSSGDKDDQNAKYDIFEAYKTEVILDWLRTCEHRDHIIVMRDRGTVVLFNSRSLEVYVIKNRGEK